MRSEEEGRKEERGMSRERNMEERKGEKNGVENIRLKNEEELLVREE